MIVYIIYSLVVLFATTIGSCAGLGGGVIIKPVLDLVGMHDISTISFLSTSSVFAMAIYSTIKQISNCQQFNYKMVICIASGSALGGIIGNKLFSALLNIFSEPFLKFIQAILLILLLIYVLVSKLCAKRKSIKEKHVIIVGLLLGMISSFLGIGGGPINVAVFVMLFSMDFKEAAIYSIFTILFSQCAKLLTIFFTTGFAIYDCSLLIVLIPVSILGGYLGVKINKMISAYYIEKIYDFTVVCIILINIFNAIQAWQFI